MSDGDAGSSADADESFAPEDGSDKLRPEERANTIAEMVLDAGTVRIDDLVQRFGTSAMTIHRDLNRLEARGVLRKSRGHVTAIATSLAEANPEYRRRQHSAEKRAVATAALAYIDTGQAVIMDDSTTSLYLASLLPRRSPLTVITNFCLLADDLKNQPGISLTVLGGQYFQWSDAYMGKFTLDMLETLRADVLIMSTPAVIDGVCFHPNSEAATLKKAMFNAAKRRILIVDHSKFTRRALHAHIHLNDFDVVIVDSKISQELADQLRSVGVNLHIASD